MGRQSRSRLADRAIALLANQQFGVVARWQLIERGVTDKQIATRLAAGRFIELHRGVYLVGHEARHPHATKMAAVLACRNHAVLSHRTAADLWEILPYPAQGDIWVTIPPGRSAHHRGVRIVRAHLVARDVCRRGPLPITSPPRTLLDIAAAIEPDQLERAVAQAQFRRLATEPELRDQLERNRNKRGIRALRQVLELPDGPQRTRSGGERRMLRLLREARIRGFEANAKAFGYEIDFLWRDLDFAVEVDGWDGHSGRIAFERDRVKINRLSARGITVMPVSARRLKREPQAVERDLREALAEAQRRRGIGPSGNGR
jgi:very-short-patch-repair endonuclease